METVLVDAQHQPYDPQGRDAQIDIDVGHDKHPMTFVRHEFAVNKGADDGRP